jgi:hypothetical protein
MTALDKKGESEVSTKKKPNGMYASEAAASQAARRVKDNRRYCLFKLAGHGWGYAFEGSVGANEVQRGTYDALNGAEVLKVESCTGFILPKVRLNNG